MKILLWSHIVQIVIIVQGRRLSLGVIIVNGRIILQPHARNYMEKQQNWTPNQSHGQETRNFQRAQMVEVKDHNNEITLSKTQMETLCKMLDKSHIKRGLIAQQGTNMTAFGGLIRKEAP